MDWLDWLAEVRVALLVFADFAGSAGSWPGSSTMFA
jgi:hypothetical protein